MSERVERLLAALIILAALVLLIVMAWPVSPPGVGTQPASMTGTASIKARSAAAKTRDRDAPSYKGSREERVVREEPSPRVVVLERRDAPPPCGDCDEPRYDNYGYEIPRRGPCGGGGPCYCDDAWRPYWAWPRGGCR